ncbi:MAG: EamA family transporter [Candidatus Levybacteria bacterium]|nr:EamA family transporter [Candidatus Levybacteria bacterium]
MSWLTFALLNSFFDSVSSALGKRGAQKINILSVTWAQRFFGLLIIIPLAVFLKSFHPVGSPFWPALLATSILNTITSILFIKAIKDSPLSLTLPITTFTPVFLLITSPIMLGEFPKPLGVIGILSVVIGSYILNLSKRTNGAFEPIMALFKNQGSRLMLIVAVIWSITSNIDKIVVTNSNPLLASLASNIAILIFLTLVLWVRKVSILHILKQSKILAPIGIANGLSYAFQMTAISMTLVANVISVKRTHALFGTIWGKIFFKEENIKERFAGAFIMVIGVILIALS